MLRAQLFSYLPKYHKVISHVTERGVRYLSGENIPFIRYPNGIPCFEANAYMLKLAANNMSRLNRGGTLRQAALKISSLLRFCFNNDVLITSITDSLFTLFIKTLQSERLPNGRHKRTMREVIRIGCSSLNYIEFVSNLYGRTDLIGQNGQICALKKTKRIINVDTGELYQSAWHHRSFPAPNPIIKRLPIGEDAVSELKSASRKTANLAIRKRRECMIAMLENSGARRGELSQLMTADVEKARQSRDEFPLLRFITLKRRTSHERYLPIPRPTIELLVDYIRTTRRMIIRKTIGESSDHGVIFINHVTGQPLATDTFTKEFSLLRIANNIKKPAHAHLFRHRFISDMLIRIMIEHDIRNPDTFRKALLDANSFKLQLLEWTGQRSLESINRYIDFAAHKLARASDSTDSVLANATLLAAKSNLDYLENELKSQDASQAPDLNFFASMLHAINESLTLCIKT